MKKELIILLAIMIVSPIINADIIMQSVDKTSDISLDKKLDLELRDAIVEIKVNEREQGSLIATFNVYSNEKEKINTRVYLKAQGQSCDNRGCEGIDVVEETFFNINSPYDHYTIGPENGEYTSDAAEIYQTEEGKFASVEFILKPGMNEIKIYQPIYSPFEYYLDSLSTFKKADHEIITIEGSLKNVTFNEHYPIKKISENKWVWEYSDIDVNDPYIKDVLIISPTPEPVPESNNLICYIVGAIVLIGIIATIIKLKK